jgi:peptidoglycan/xylan/chitin deacetylase (PgdA/CDA1 family)
MPLCAACSRKSFPTKYLIIAALLLVGCGGGSQPAASPVLPTPQAHRALVSLDFDDGFESGYLNGLPLFEAAGMKTTHFIITQKVGTPLYITIGQLQAISANNEIAAHTRTHPHLSTLTPAQQTWEIQGSKDDLVAWGYAPTDFAYPYGDFDADTQSITAQYFATGRTVDDSELNTAQTPPVHLYAYPLSSTTLFQNVQAAIDRADAEGTWVIIVFHRVDEDGNPISVKSDLIKEIVAHLQQKNAQVVSHTEAEAILGIK